MYYYKHKTNFEVLSTNDGNILADDTDYIPIDENEYNTIIKSIDMASSDK